MLNGIAPVIIFHLYTDFAVARANWVAKNIVGKISLKKDLKFSKDKKGIGVPIPIYLSESLFKTAWQDHNLSFNIGTKTVGKETIQIPYNANITINLAFNRVSGVLSKLIPLLDLCYSKIASDTYAISYYNKDIIFQKAKLSSFTQSSNANSELSTLNITLSRAVEEKEKITELPWEEYQKTTVGSVPIDKAV